LRAARLALLGTILLSAVLSAGGCGGGNEAAPTTTTTTTVVGGKTGIRVYWLRDGKVWPVRRTVEATDLVATGAVAELLRGPSQREKFDLEATTAIPSSVDSAELNIKDRAARVKLSGDDLPRPAVCQLVYTLTQFPDVRSVVVKGKTYTRSSCENVTPAILVESPLPFDEVRSPLHATGTANTFEATFQYEVTDPDGKVVAKNFVTATSGTGTRGTFNFTTKPFKVPFTGAGELIVYELSAENGQRIHVVEIPLRMKK
jgi:hypothetical protein